MSGIPTPETDAVCAISANATKWPDFTRNPEHQWNELLEVAQAVERGGMSYPKYLRDKATAAIAKVKGIKSGSESAINQEVQP